MNCLGWFLVAFVFCVLSDNLGIVAGVVWLGLVVLALIVRDK
jgi:hypothetical protein